MRGAGGRARDARERGLAHPWILAVRQGLIMGAAALPLRPREPVAVERRGRATGPRLTVLVANVAHTKSEPAAQAAALLAVDADLLLVVEHTAATAGALAAAGLADRYQHTCDEAAEGFFGSLVASRHPIVSGGRTELGGRRAQVVDLDVDGVRLRVVPVHTQAPVHPHDVPVWHATIAANAAVAADAPGPVLLAGDWNATGGHRRLRRALADHSLVDAQVRVGRRWAPTWPVDRRIAGIGIPPLLRLDRVVTSADVDVTTLERIAIPASDHRALRAELRLPA